MLISDKHLDLGCTSELIEVAGLGRLVEIRLVSVLVVETNAVSLIICLCYRCRHRHLVAFLEVVALLNHCARL